MKKGQLFSYHNEIQEWIHTGSVLCVFNRSRINDFYKEYGLRLNTLFKEVSQHQELFYQMEGEGEKRTVKREEGKPLLAEGKTQEDANEAWADWAAQSISDTIQLVKA